MKSDIGTTVIETESFVKQAAAIWSPADLDQLKDYVARNPLAGAHRPPLWRFSPGWQRRLRPASRGIKKRNANEQEDGHTHGIR